MNLRNILLILTLVGFLAVVVVGYFKYSAGSSNGPATIPAGMVIAAAHPIETGSLITPDAIVFAQGPANALPDTYFERQVADNQTDQPGLDAQIRNEVLGAVARHSYDAGQLILRDTVVKPGDSGFLAAVLRPGMRAITIGVTAISGAAGLVYPGDHVDLLLTQNFNGELGVQHHSVSELVAQNVRVLAIDQQLQAQAKQSGAKVAQTVTLEATPTQATDVNLAKNLGDLTLTIRSVQAGPPTIGEAPEATWAEDVSPALKYVEDQAPSRKTPPSMVVIRGDTLDVVKLQQ